MNDLNFISALDQKLESTQQVPGNDTVVLTKQELARVVSQHTVEAIAQFIRHQRSSGVQTVRYADINDSNIDCLVRDVADSNLIRSADMEALAKELRERVVDILPVADGQLFELCAQHKTLAHFGLASEVPL